MNRKTIPKVRDSSSFVYLERCRVDVEDGAVVARTSDGDAQVPVAGLLALMLGPGTTMTHAAARLVGECGCTVVWTGQDGTRFYVAGSGTTSTDRLETQARHFADPDLRTRVVARMWRTRFGDDFPAGASVEQVRGHEGRRVRDRYARLAREHGVEWSGRTTRDWESSDVVNKAVSTAASVLNAVCHAAVVACGYSPSLGFVHVGKPRSFVYDVADIYKLDVVTPVGFRVAAEGAADVERAARTRAREAIREHDLLGRVARDLDALFEAP